MRSFLKAIGEVISAILYAIKKAHERKQMDQNRVSRSELDSDPVRWYRMRYSGKKKADTTNP